MPRVLRVLLEGPEEWAATPPLGPQCHYLLLEAEAAGEGRLADRILVEAVVVAQAQLETWERRAPAGPVDFLEPTEILELGLGPVLRAQVQADPRHTMQSMAEAEGVEIVT